MIDRFIVDHGLVKAENNIVIALVNVSLPRNPLTGICTGNWKRSEFMRCQYFKLITPCGRNVPPLHKSFKYPQI